MTSTRRQDRGGFLLAVALAALAGWVDAVGFVRWHGLFVSFMSGNSTTLGASASGDWSAAVAPARAIATFLVGVVAGEMLDDPEGRWGRALVLGTEAALLWIGFWASAAGQSEVWTASCLGFAMGLQNAPARHAGRVSVGITYVTGTIVHVGRSLAKALQGRADWLDGAPYLGLWIGFLTGAALGAAIARVSEDWALALAAGLVTVLAAGSVLVSRAAASW